MNLPYVRAAGRSAGMLTAFGALNTNENAGEGEFVRMTNLSGRAYPYLTTRGPRAKERELNAPGGLIACADSLIWADGTSIYKDGTAIASVTAGEKILALMGARLLVWPDKIAVNLETLAVEALENRYSAAGAVSVSQSSLAGEASDTATFIKIAAAGIGAGFRAWDGVKVSGLTDTSLNGAHILYAVEPDYLIVPGVLESAFTQNGGLTVERVCPDIDFITVHQNRAWACSSAAHEIYASKLGDPGNWNAFAGTAADSYAASTGTPGDFTGAAAVNDTVVFFHEDGIHKVLGTKPANFQVVYTPAPGVMKGSEKSLCRLNGCLYYLSPDGVCAYDGALPGRVSRALDGWRLKNGAAGAAGNEYCLSCEDAEGGAHLLAYGTDTGLWHREDDTRATHFAACGGALYFIAGKALYRANSGGEVFDWECECGRMALDLPGHKYVSRVVAQCELESGARMEIAVRYEDSGPWETAAVSHGERVLTANLRERRASFARIRLRGRGACTVFSLARCLQTGSEIRPWNRR